MRRLRLSAHTIGALEIALSGFGYGLLGVIGKALFQAGITPGENLSLRFLGAALLLWGFLLLRAPATLKLPARKIVACAGLGLAGYAVFSSFYFKALHGLSVSLTVLLLYTYPILVALGQWLLLGERPGRRSLACLPVVMLGLVLLVAARFEADSGAAVAYGLGAAGLYALYVLASSRWLKGVDPIAASAYIIGFAGVALAAINLHDRAHVASLVRSGWPLLLCMVVISTVLPMVFFFRGLAKLTAAEVSMLSTVEPITAVAAAAMLLGEHLSPLQWVGAAAIVTALLVIATDSSASIS